jgi:predicted nucleotidyltransferase
MKAERLSEKLADVAEKYGIRIALLFGSSVSGRLHHRSDIDVAVLLKSADLSFTQFAALHHELQESVPEREIDLSLLNRADPLFFKKIMESCRLLYGDERDLQKLKIYSFRRFQDHGRFLRLEREYVKRFLQTAGTQP